MRIEEIIPMLRWVNEADPRVQFNDAAVEQWHYALRSVEPAVAKQAVLEHVKLNEGVPVSPSAIAKRAANIRTSREAGQRAIEPPRDRVRHPLSWRARNPVEWDRLFEAGRAEGNSIRASATRAREGDQGEHDDWMAA
ncbi:hypothetical protein [Arthrobacter sp. StoSoilB13]|uniref:hypothetical protein n=1 Tax=Arthrobacter sp. StoSoilB13 TaxID=2830993 RepID=UPI001CC7A4AA|nr:hypothetical protein [Arthrobacter sp. StoSoilB13]BCW47931.1 hypothetical protein StoSoilB13_02730 [Arthrobacter sp. StoSoilB13]